MYPDVPAYIVQHGVDPSQNQQCRVSEELLRVSELVSAMRTDRPAFLVATIQSRAPLFNAICHGWSAPLLNRWGARSTQATDLDAARCYAFHVMESIWTAIPCLLQNLGTDLTVEPGTLWVPDVISSACPILHQQT